MEIRQTEQFGRWFAGLRDRRARRRIQVRIDRLQIGNAGDVRPVGGGVSEMRSITVPDIGSISFNGARHSSSCSPAATKVRRSGHHDGAEPRTNALRRML
jgi:hypothetical protein